MGPKKQKIKKLKSKKRQSTEPEEQVAVDVNLLEINVEADGGQEGDIEQSEQATVTTTETSKKRYGAARGPSAMSKVLIKKAKGKKFKVTCNYVGVPVGKIRHTLQSYIGMLARTMIPVDIKSWPFVERELKTRLWKDVQNAFKIPEECEALVLKSAGTKWRQFKSELTTEYVIPFKGDKKKLRKPPKKYGFVGKDVWKKFVGQRTTEKWMELRGSQSERVKKRKYPHRTSRKGYIGLEEEEVKAGRLQPGEKPDRAILWKKARETKDGIVVDPELANVVKRIDELLEMKEKGEFQSCGSDDVLSRALETPEHSGRVRGVGSYVSPKLWFDLPKEKRNRITKKELEARDRQRDEEMERTRQEMERTKQEMERTKQEMAELKSLISASNVISSPLSDKASFQVDKGGPNEALKAARVLTPMKELPAVNDIEYVGGDPPGSPEKKGPRSCELSVDNIKNKVAFGTIFDDPEMNSVVHGVLVQPGHVRVSVDGAIQADALLPVPVEGELETVRQAIGSTVSWPKDLITVAPVKIRKEGISSKKKDKNELRRVVALFHQVEVADTVPNGFKLLFKHATTIMKETGDSIAIPCDTEVFGCERVIYILHENLIALLKFEEIGQAAISAHMSYLHSVIREKNELDMYAFFDPGATFTLNKDFEKYVVSRLSDGSYDRMFLMPHNHKYHWILIIIWAGDIFILNPMSHPTNFPHLEKPLLSAMKTFNAQTGRGNNVPKIKNLAGSPKQPGGHECGYVVMRYMKDIIEDKEMKFVTKWASKSRKCYKMEELDTVRVETLAHIQDKM